VRSHSPHSAIGAREQQASGRRSPEAFAVLLLAVLLTMPLYFVTVPDGIAFAPLLAFEAGRVLPAFGIPLAVLGIVFLGVVWLIRLAQHRLRVQRNSRVLFVALALIAWMATVAAYGAAISDRPIATAALFGQTVLPLLAFVAFLTIPLDRSSAERAVLAIPVAGSVSIVVMLLAAVYFFQRYPPLPAFAYLAEAFYSAKNIHPVVVAVGLAILLAELSMGAARAFSGVALWGMLLIHAAYLLILWSRSGLLMIGTVLFLWLVREGTIAIRGRRFDARFWIPRASATSLLAVFTALSFTVAGLSFRSVGTELTTVSSVPEGETTVGTPSPQLAEPAESSETARATPGKRVDESSEAETDPAASARQQSVGTGNGTSEATQAGQDRKNVDRRSRAAEALQAGDSRRVKLVEGGLALVRDNPIGGVAFNPMPPGSVVYGRLESDHKLYPSHNQFVDFAVRAGVPALLLYIALLASMGVELRRSASIAGRGTFEGEVRMAALFVLVAAAASTVFQAYFVVTQPALLIFLLCGLALAEH